ncbi:MAG: Shedu immune nuclease family protein [Nostoc sp.]|uniref:Shedu immune nuclease family protein n=1 Tax=Nostoc sp. TaxID=1180 RepID=UPI002FFB4EA2
MTDKEQSKAASQQSPDKVLMLPADTSLMARVKLKPEKELQLGSFVHKSLRVKESASRSFIEIIIRENLYISTTGRNKLRDCRCEIPALPDQYGDSVNNANTKISLAFEYEPNELRSPGGSAINEVYFLDDDNYWKPLRVLRDKKLPNLGKLDIEEVKAFLLENQDILAEILKNNITKEDLIALAYRKEQLNIFNNLLHNPFDFETYKEQFELKGDEAVWQHFFERNTWIFGYGLNYIFTSPLSDLKLEQVVQGYSLFQSGKRVDALLKTRGFISSLCFAEIKTHNTPLIEPESYRSACYCISRELAGAVSQIQKTVQKAVTNIRTKLEVVTQDGDPTDDVAYLYQPRSFIVVGRLDEFQTSKGTNEEKFGSFELFRQNINNPEVITFDELYERARFIIRRAER